MTSKEKASVVALAKLLGSPLSVEEILEKYSEYFQEAENVINQSAEPEKQNAIVQKRTF